MRQRVKRGNLENNLVLYAQSYLYKQALCSGAAVGLG